MGRDSRRLPGAKIADTEKTAGMTPPAREAKESAGKMPEAAPRDGGANLNEAVSIARVEEGASGKRGAAGVRPPCGKHDQPQAGECRQDAGVGRREGEWLRIPWFIKGTNSRPVAGFVAFYNCIRRHLGLGGDTPAKAAGIIIKGASPRATLIKNAYWQA